MFVEALKETLNEEYNYSVTENGALGYRTTGKELLDLNFSVAFLRKAGEKDIIDKFTKAYCENPVAAMRWLFYARDVREGMGERRLFQIIANDFAKTKPELYNAIAPLISEYGRWDDLVSVLYNNKADKKVKDTVISILDEQLTQDWIAHQKNKPISLLAKWLPTAGASSKKTSANAATVYTALGLKEKEYRKAISELRKYIDVVERKMCANEWSEIDYEKVPSRANLVHNSAFLKHDEDRRRDYLEKANKGEVKINASVLYPHEIVAKYCHESNSWGWNEKVGARDEALEALWKNLPDTVEGNENTIVVADGSGSMTVPVGNGKSVSALDVANALAIYFAERSSGEFKDKYITFSSRPQFVDFSKCTSLHDKISLALTHCECSNTNIEAVFDLILTTAIKNKMSQDDMPKNILIVSDMEFDYAQDYGRALNERLFTTIGTKYKNAGYQLPRLIFWNVNSRTGTIPVKENELGVALVSGFSVNTMKMVMSNKTDPYECLLEAINVERYDAIEKAVEGKL